MRPFPLSRALAITALALLLPLLATATQAADLPGLDRTLSARGDLPSVEDLLGFSPGERHPRNHELVAYYRELAERSERMRVETIGTSSGGNEHVLAYFGRPDRLEQLDALRAGRIEASRDGTGPVIVWLGYSVHGNEASGASAAPIVAWFLAASDAPELDDWFEHVIVVMEPVINPDGVDRFAHWANMHRGRHPSADPNDREHAEGWPNGRTSYYWFDLNRDWLPLTHPVSKQRIRHYRQWRPHVLTDAHEMGHRSTYFFQPGIPERNNPDTPPRVFELTERIAEYHARRLDAAGEPYYSRESFDDYYLGKGSTYPDLTGGIGILFEQGTARGHVIDTPYGQRRFVDAVANQVRTSLSTLEASVALRDELRAYQRQSFVDARDAGPRRGGWLIGDGGDPQRALRLLETLVGHGIEVRPVDGRVTISGREQADGTAWAIPARQDLARFVRAIFATPRDLPMETFYDVSAWPLQHAFDLPFEAVDRLPATGDALAEPLAAPSAPSAVDTDALAWAVDWSQHRAPALLSALLADGYRVQAAEQPTALSTTEGERTFGRGSLVVHSGIQPADLPDIGARLAELSERFGVEVASIGSGLARAGLDLGSPSVAVMDTPKVAMLTGPGINPYNAGTVWRWFDVHLEQPMTMLNVNRLPADLDRYSHLVLPDGNHEFRGEAFRTALVDYVRSGGTLVALRSSARWVEDLELEWSFVEEGDDPEEDRDEPAERKRYSDHELDFARRLIGGSALTVEIDPTHPLAWGYDTDDLVLFRQGAHVLRTSTNVYARPGVYGESPLVAGYLADPVAEDLAGTTALGADRLGDGLVIRMADDVLFRGYWAGAEKLFANALFHSKRIGRTQLQ
ncbi:M14 family zinc carboxypeptidase [Halomonas denitrificans]|nr:hypothetical protein [Halomonas denitrificans]